MESTNEISYPIIKQLQLIQKEITNLPDHFIGNISDGYHSFNELYEFRKIYNALLFNEWHNQNKYEVYKSKKHFDGIDCFDGGWFIVVAILPTGQISNHYKNEDWELFKIPEYEKSKYEFDNHSSNDVLIRLKSII